MTIDSRNTNICKDGYKWYWQNNLPGSKFRSKEPMVPINNTMQFNY